MNLQIVVPTIGDISGDAYFHAGLANRVSSPALSRLLAIGQHTRVDLSLEAMLCQRMGVQQQADWPIAALAWLGETRTKPGAASPEVGAEPETYWLRADPVHFVLQRDSFSLASPAPLALADNEAQALLAALNQHFRVDGLQFERGQSCSAWYLGLKRTPAIQTTPAIMAVGRSVTAYLPQGAEVAEWHHLLNEIQMLLHGHPVNQARETVGELPVNSLWLSGGGVLPTKLQGNLQGIPLRASIKAIFSDMPLLCGIASMANIRQYPVPATLDTVLKNVELADNMPASTSQTKEIWLTLESLQDAEQHWFSPFLNALRTGRIKQITLHFAIAAQVLSVVIRRRDLWKFWRKTRPFERYFMDSPHFTH